MFGDLSYYNRQTIHGLYVPLAIGMIAQYAKQEFGDEIRVSLSKDINKFFNKAEQNPPDVVGLSVYYWNIAINQYLVKCIRQKFGGDVIIVLGGPTIDSDEQEQHRYLSTVFPEVDAIILNEGEISFNNILRKILDNRNTVFKDPIEGVSFLDGNRLVDSQSPHLYERKKMSYNGALTITCIINKKYEIIYRKIRKNTININQYYL